LDAGTTAFEVVNALARRRAGGPNELHTNNLAVLISALHFQMPCKLLGGPVDPSHLCTLPDFTPDVLKTFLPAGEFQTVVTAASVRVSGTGITIRARRPDQFTFKKSLLALARYKTIAIDHTKWTDPFDGQFEFEVPLAGVRIVVDKLPPASTGGPGLAATCSNAGVELHVSSRES
jgi:DeoR/GlpR family transcriptional regulator of sugar metabolism